MTNTFLSLKSGEAALSTLKAAANRKPSTNELFEQRVSFVYSAMSGKSGVSRERVRELVGAHESSRADAFTQTK